ncbi:uncharacterized protein LOC134944978 [Pseudophryne corroboree]|uniref:uncharacterized protein LOC134944978 n=1 Tax=Pseudophryne corroboree TaxID=495146 RepID=UPI003081D4D9
MEEWIAIADKFDRRWHFPNCGGAIDDKHIRITPPANSVSFYYNYKGYFSMVLMVVVNANYEFLCVDVGKNGRASDSGSFKNMAFYNQFTTKTLHLPSREAIKHGLNYVFVADEAFALHENVMKPFPQRVLNKEITALGILSNQFQIFHMAIHLKVEKIDLVVTACCVLHKKATQQRTVATVVLEDPEYPEEVAQFPSVAGRPVCETGTALAKKVRVEYMAYFNEDGVVLWQEE